MKLLLPWFHAYLDSVPDGLLLFFTHRWLLVCLKREFKDEDFLLIWEACWTNYETNSFHLFVCLAIMAMYGQKVLDEAMNTNEITAHFNMLASKMPVDIVLTQARGYLYQFMRCGQVSCVLRPIMRDSYWSGESALNPAAGGKRPSLLCECDKDCVIVELPDSTPSSAPIISI